MEPSTALLFPGQGAYLPGVLGEWVHHFPSAAVALETVDDVAAQYDHGPVSPLLLKRDAPPLDELLVQNGDVVDLAIYAINAAAFEILVQLGVRADLLVGHSFGEFAALSAAGTISVADVTRLACLRVEAPRRVEPVEGGLVALNMSAGRARHLVAVLDEPRLCVAIDNGPDQSVLSGPASSLAEVEKVAAGLDIRTTRLKARYAFHNPLMYPAADLFVKASADVVLNEPRVPVFSPTLGRFVRSAADAREVINRNMVTPVHFYDGLLTLFRDGIRVFIEVGARQALSRIVHSSLPSSAIAVPLLPTRGGPDETLKGLSAAGISVQWPPSEVAAGAAFADQSFATRAEAPAQEEKEEELPDGSRLIDELTKVYADDLGFPVEMLTPDIDLEADLGVDSLKQIALFERVRQLYGLPELPPQQRLQATTLEQLAGIVEDMRR
ncbi:acyltransferase domain-containing protein [Streptomyces sp. ISL-11]|uniref:acyltransferase domain-containing protein n=1 Tax=Streptomyces sp. ISL-11 TaxID=2819174 RepID=UPI001BECDA43|nr:acyltransferase domain-containing protein [Streptomyces sp. ISL-11]MBT2385285.1 acyltransferase domain-containing protein [Streptomyces sp. ISL-11]